MGYIRMKEKLSQRKKKGRKACFLCPAEGNMTEEEQKK